MPGTCCDPIRYVGAGPKSDAGASATFVAKRTGHGAGHRLRNTSPRIACGSHLSTRTIQQDRPSIAGRVWVFLYRTGFSVHLPPTRSRSRVADPFALNIRSSSRCSDGRGRRLPVRAPPHPRTDGRALSAGLTGRTGLRILWTWAVWRCSAVGLIRCISAT